MAKKQTKNKKPSQRWKHYEVKDGKLIRKNPTSPKMGPGIFMAVHKDRVTCGKSGYTEFKKDEKHAEVKPKAEEKPVEVKEEKVVEKKTEEKPNEVKEKK